MITVKLTKEELFNLINILSIQAQINEEHIPLYVKLAELQKEKSNDY